METIMNKSLCICGCCKRELPQEAFYMNQRTRTTDNYCKECRRQTHADIAIRIKVYYLKTNLFPIR